ncbi:hypothetical protein [Ktedonospora formicarum]|uniref:Uncharacterized protein n=1 Tax=Ktedonospora formicarum TaxID=2778364 RepID=A0A8J3I2R5_9CHLR|nr:hypothetical protein [Ktedonospora formicarum]GHO47706.1 hypothetical protein KSX_58690 [Ktedonospora formicarum]
MTRQFLATPLGGESTKLPPKQSLKETLQSQAKQEERLAQYHQVVALRELGLNQTGEQERPQKASR